MPPTMSALRPGLAVVLLAILGAGCQVRVDAPRGVRDPVRVYLVDHGTHASVLLPRGDDGRLVRWDWGDWRWYALGRTTPLEVVGMALGGRAATIARGEVGPDPGGPHALRRRLGAQAVFAIPVERDAAGRLGDALQGRFDAAPAERRAPDPYGRVVFAPDASRRYWLGSDSTAEARRWLVALGCRVRGLTPFAVFEAGEGVEASHRPRPLAPGLPGGSFRSRR